VLVLAAGPALQHIIIPAHLIASSDEIMLDAKRLMRTSWLWHSLDDPSMIAVQPAVPCSRQWLSCLVVWDLHPRSCIGAHLTHTLRLLQMAL